MLRTLIDAVIVAARSLHLFIRLGAGTDQQIRRIDDTFAELGIDVGTRDR